MILDAINLESNNGEEAKSTRVQIQTNLAYNKLVRYFKELEVKEMILQDPLQITKKGRISCKIMTVLKMGLTCIDIMVLHHSYSYYCLTWR